MHTTNEFISISGLNIHVRRKGSGSPAIIFLHGNSNSSAIWDYQRADAQLNVWQLITIDTPGHGRSDKAPRPEETYTMAALAACMAEVISRLQLHSYILAGYSFGTNLIAEMLPVLKGCHGLFLIAACIMNRNTNPQDVFKPSRFSELLTASPLSDEVLNGALSELSYQPTVALLTCLRNGYLSTDPAFRTAIVNIFRNTAWGDEIKAIKESGLPVALIYGSEEKTLYTHYLATAFPQLWKRSIQLIPEAAHCVQMDQPKVVNGLLAEFMRTL